MPAPDKATTGRVLVGATTYAARNLMVEQAAVVAQSLHSGLQMPTNLRVAGAEVPRLRFDMFLDDALDAFGLTYAEVTTLEAYFAKTSSGVVQSGSVHVKYGKFTGCTIGAHIESFGVDEGGEAIATVCAYFFSDDGANDPVARTASVALPALTALPEVHGIGVLTINGTARAGMTGCRYAANLSLVFQRTDGLPYPTGGVVSGFSPVLTIAHADPVALSSIITSKGVAISSTTSVTLQKYTAAGSGVLTTTGQKTITVAAGYVSPVAFGGGHGDLVRGGCEIRGVSTNGSAHPFTVA